MKCKVMIENDQNKVKLPSGYRLLLRRACLGALTLEHFEEDAQVSITVTDNEEIQILNLEHRAIDAPTDVLSFPLGEGGVFDRDLDTGEVLLGDIVLSVEKAKEQAEEYGHSLERELAFLTVHSMLHLLGYDHEQGEEARQVMRRKEEAVLARLGLTRDQ